MRTVKNFKCPMRDGVLLATDLYLPDEEGAYPVILMRTPYNKNGFCNDPLYSHYDEYVAKGYVVAIQDCRGTCASEGKINLNGGNEKDDGYDTIEFLAAQPFCDGNVGTFGLSYFGYTQAAAAFGAPPHLKAACPFMCGSLASFGTSRMQTIASFHLGWAYGQLLERADTYFPDEEFRKQIVPVLRENYEKLGEYSRVLPMNQNPAALISGVPMLRDYIDLVEGVEKKEFWDSINSPMSYDAMHTAMLFGTGWMDGACNSTIENFMAARRSEDAYTRENARLLIGPWTHGGVLPSQIEDINFGDENTGENQDVAGMMLRWFNRYLKNERDDCFDGRVRYFIMGSNDWHTSQEWPPREADPVRWYLSEGGKLEKAIPQSGEIKMIYDPENPAPSALVDQKKRSLMADWSEISGREDVVEFASDVLEEDMTIAGSLNMCLYAAADVPDTDFVCRLTDIAPDGYQRQIAVGYVRARHRKGLFQNDFLTPGETVCYEFGLGHTGYCMEKGHAIGVQVMGSLFPAINRNLNTTEPPALGSTWQIAHDRIFFGGKCASCIEIPVLRG